MIDGVDFKLDGMEALREKFQRLRGNGGRRVITRATRGGLKETRKKARQNALKLDDPKTAESIAKNIAIKVNSKRFNSHGAIYGRVGVTGGAQQGKGGGGSGGDTYYWRFLEFGWIPADKNSKGKSIRRRKSETARMIEMGTSRIGARPFLRPAMNPSQMTQAFVTAFREALDKELQKQGLS